MSHGHDDSHGSAPAVAGEPTPFLSDPSQFTTTRCKRRFNDLVLLQLDARSPESVKGAFVAMVFAKRVYPCHPLPATGPKPRFSDPAVLGKLVRERYLLFVNCLESKPGQEPKHAYLYPQAAAPAAHH